MRRKRALKRGRALWILAAGGVGYLLGGWQTVALRSSPDLSATQTIALRFPDDADVTATVLDAAASSAATASATGAAKAMVLGPAELALLSPEPLVQVPQAQSQIGQSSPQAQPAAAESAAASSPRAEAPATAHPRTAAVLKAIAPIRTAAAAALAAVIPHHAERPGFLNDAQIASIKGRLHLTPDQERMWPAVEAALRNIAYANARDARRRGVPPGATDAAAIDPNGAEVANLKSAAIPLIMSFDDEQRNEVRSLAHVMGLDRLASEF
jgi:hypothetical protein